MPFQQGHKGFRSKESYARTNGFGQYALHWKGGKPKCEDCGKVLSAYAPVRCVACYHKTRLKPPPEFVCQWCEKKFVDEKRDKDRKFCSKECHDRSRVGSLAWNSGKKQPQTLGERNGYWKGDDVGYCGLHAWVKRHLGRPDTCEHCGANGLSGYQIHWANKSGDYKRDLTDWIRLCASCHKLYDLNKIEVYV